LGTFRRWLGIMGWIAAAVGVLFTVLVVLTIIRGGK
jgi:hypothetical protein